MKLPGNRTLLLAGDGLSAFGTWIDFLAILTLAAYQFSVTPWQMAVVSAAGLLPGILLAPLIGRLCDRGNPQHLLLYSIAARVAATGAIIFCHDFTAFALLVGLRSVFAMVAMPAINVMAVRAIDVAERPQFYSVLNVLNNAAKILAPAIGTISSSLAGEVFALAMSLAFSTLAFVVFACVRLESRAAVAAANPQAPAPAAVAPVLPLLWIASTYAFFVFMVNNLVPLVLQQAGFDKALLGVLVSCSGAGNILSGLWLARRPAAAAMRGDIGELLRPALLAAAGFGGIGLLFWLGGATAPRVLPVVFFVIGIVSARFAIALNVYITRHFPTTTGHVSGLLQAWQNAMILVAPLVGAWVLQAHGAPALFGFAALSAAASFGVFQIVRMTGRLGFAPAIADKKMPAGRR